MTSRPVVGVKVATGFGPLFLALSLAVAPAQEPVSSASGGLAYVPDRALACLSINEGAVLVKSAGAGFGTFTAGMAAWLGVEPTLLGDAFLKGRVTAALMPTQGLDEPAMLLVFGRGRQAAETLFKALSRSPEGGRKEGEASGNSLTVYALPAPVNLTFYGLERGSDFLAATSKELLVTAMAAQAAPGTASALADTGVRKAAAELDAGPGVLVSCRPSLLGSQGILADFLSGGATRVIWSAVPAKGGTDERLRIDWPGARAGWAALPGDGPLPVGFGGFLPKSIAMGLVAKVDMAVLQASFTSSTSPWASLAAGRTTLPWDSLTPALSGAVALGRSAQGEIMGVLGLKDQTAADKALREFGLKRGGIGEETISGYTVFKFKEGDKSGFAWTLAENRLVFADSTEALAGLFVCLEAPGTAVVGGESVSWRIWGDGATASSLVPAILRPCFDRPGLVFDLAGGGDPACLHLRLSTNSPPSALALLGCMSLPTASAGGIKEGEALAAPPDTNWSNLSTQDKFKYLLELQNIGLDAQVAPDVARLLQDDSPAVAARAAYVLGKHQAKGFTPELCGVLARSTSAEVKRYAVYALMEVPDPRAEKFLVQALASKDPETVGLAATALERLGLKRTAIPLANALMINRDASDAVRSRILTALALVGRERVLPRILLGADKDDSYDLISAWVYCIQELTPRLGRAKEERFLVGLLDFPCIHLRRYAVDRLGEMGSEAVGDALTRRAELEGDALKPAIKLAVAAVESRGDTAVAIQDAVESTAGEMLSLQDRAEAFMEDVKTWPTWKKGLLVALPLLMGLALLVLRKLAKGRSRRRTANQLAALVAPSEELQLESDEEVGLVDEEVDLDMGGESEFDVDLEDAGELEEMIPSAREDEAFSALDEDRR